MKWIIGRAKEPSTWAGISALVLFKFLWGVMPPTMNGHFLLIISLFCALFAMVLEESR